MAKQLEARILLKHDTTANWEKVHTKFVPLAGEMIVYDDYEPVWELNSDGSYVIVDGHKVQKKVIDKTGVATYVWVPGLKIGTGYNYLIDLPFVQITPDIKDKMEFWNNKLNVDDSPEGCQYMADVETLIFNRN